MKSQRYHQWEEEARANPTSHTEESFRKACEYKDAALEEASELVERVRSQIGGVQDLFDSSEIASVLSPDDAEKLEKLKSLWGVEVVGKLKAFERTGKHQYYTDISLYTRQASGILRGAILSLLIKKAESDWGIDLHDKKLKELVSSTTVEAMGLLPGDILSGKKTVADIDAVLLQVADEITSASDVV